MEHEATPSAWNRRQSGSRRTSLYVAHLAISAAAKTRTGSSVLTTASERTMNNTPTRQSAQKHPSAGVEQKFTLRGSRRPGITPSPA